jgi:hypothetical protein
MISIGMRRWDEMRMMILMGGISGEEDLEERWERQR